METSVFMGLGHTILGNFSIDQMVQELNKISKKAQNYRTKKDTGKP